MRPMYLHDKALGCSAPCGGTMMGGSRFPGAHVCAWVGGKDSKKLLALRG